jgi:NMT1-like family
MGGERSGTWTVSQMIVGQCDLSLGSFELKGSTWNFDQTARALLDNHLAVAFFVVGFGSPALNTLAEDGAGRFTLLSVDWAEGLIAAYPFLERSTITHGSYPSIKSFPDIDVTTISTRELLISGDQLSERHAFQFVNSLFSSSSQLVRYFPLLTQLSRHEPQQSFYCSLHPGALSFYRRSSSPASFSWPIVHRCADLVDFDRHCRADRRPSAASQSSPDRTRLCASGRGQGGFVSRADFHEDRYRGLKERAFELHRTWRIKEDGYDCLKEYLGVCLSDLAARRNQLRTDEDKLTQLPTASSIMQAHSG